MASSKITPIVPALPGPSGKTLPAIGTYGITKAELAELNQEQMTKENKEQLKKIGGPNALTRLLQVDPRHGLTQKEIDSDFETRRDFFGNNVFSSPPMKGFWYLFCCSFQDTTLLILIGAATASLITGFLEDPDKGWIEGVAILFAVIVVALVTAANDYTKEKQFRALSSKNDDILVKVLRAGKNNEIFINELNVGDIVILQAGDKIPADGVFLKGQDLKSNESSLTGEPDDITKNSIDDPFLLSGGIIASGQCEYVIIAVGSESRWGRIKSKLVQEPQTTPLMEKLDGMAKMIGYIGTGAALSTIIAMLLIYSQSAEKQEKFTVINYLLHAFIIGITIVVVAIPEGLPLAVTISLSYSTKKMLKDNNLIRVLAACETMGNVTSICSDKTGTLTMNRMTVVEAYIASKHFVDGTIQSSYQLPHALLHQIAVSISINSSAHLNNVDDNWIVQGNKTEGALLLWLQAGNFKYNDLRKEYLNESRGDRIFTFSSAKKSMSVIVKNDDGSCTLYCKGAAEIILQRCVGKMSSESEVTAFDGGMTDELNAKIVEMAQCALRTVCVAHRDFSPGELPDDLSTLNDAPDSNLIFDAIFGIMDPLRPDVTESVATCHKAGILVRMVTGDNIHTAKAIAKKCGILSSDGVAMEGPVFRKMSEADLEPILPNLEVLARSSPDDKHRLVNMLKKKNEVVGVTGDGTNDAPALKAADVGLSMGIAGTDLAKEASDIVIMDDKFSSIKQAVLWGRSVYDNIRKFLQFQLTVNVVALIVTFIGAVAGFEPPLNAVMMLWVNLIMDTMGALALGTEAPTLSLLDRRPYRRGASLVNAVMWRNILVQSLYQLALLLLILFSGPSILGVHQGNYCEKWKYSLKAKMPATVFNATCITSSKKPCAFLTCAEFSSNTNPADYPIKCVDSICNVYDYTHYTVIFNVFVFCQIFNEFNARSVTSNWKVFAGLSRNFMFVFIIGVTIAVQVLVVQIGGDWTKTSPLSLSNWTISFLLGFGALPLGVLMRFIPIEESEADFARPNKM